MGIKKLINTNSHLRIITINNMSKYSKYYKYYKIFDKYILIISNKSEIWNEYLTPISSIFIILCVILTLSDVIARFLFNNPIKGTTEIEQVMLSFIAFFSISYALVKNQHVRVLLFFDKFNKTTKIITEIIIGIAGFIIFILMLLGGIEQFWRSWMVNEVMPAAIKIPFWIPKFIVLLGAFLTSLQFFIYSLKNITQLNNRKNK